MFTLKGFHSALIGISEKMNTEKHFEKRGKKKFPFFSHLDVTLRIYCFLKNLKSPALAVEACINICHWTTAFEYFAKV